MHTQYKPDARGLQKFGAPVHDLQDIAAEDKCDDEQGDGHGEPLQGVGEIATGIHVDSGPIADEQAFLVLVHPDFVGKDALLEQGASSSVLR